MVVEFLLPSTVLTWVADEIFGAFKQKYVEPGISKLLFTPDDYKIELVNSINNVIEKYEKIYPPSGKFPFYHHKETLARLSNYILFNEKDGNILRALNFSEIQNIDTPTLEQVEHFYNFFIEEITNNLKLKQLYIEENYKEKIFLIYKEISLIKNIIEDLVSKIP